MYLDSDNICIGQVPEIIPNYLFSIIGDNNNKPNLAIKNTVYSTGIGTFGLYETRFSFLGNTNEYGRISSKIDKNITGYTSTTTNGSLEFRTSNTQ